MAEIEKQRDSNSKPDANAKLGAKAKVGGVAKNLLSDIKKRLEGHRKASVVILVIILALAVAFLMWGISSVVMSLVDVGGITVKGESPYSEEQLIEAAGFDMSGKLRDVDLGAAEERILLKLPYIYEVKVSRAFPNRIKISLKSRDAIYYTELSGRYFALSSDMVVLEEQKDEEIFRSRSLTELVLPDIHSAVLSRKVEYGVEGTDYGYIFDLIDRLSESQFGGGITRIDFRDKFDMSFVYRGKHMIIIGSSVDLDLKLTASGEVLASDMFQSEIYAILNATSPKCVTVTQLSEKDFLEKTE